MKKAVVFLTTVALMMSVASISYADHGGQHPFGKRGYQHGSEKDYACPITGKFMGKAHFFLENQKELGLTEDQVNSIKQLKLETKKAYIRQMADHQVFALDVKHKLSEPTVDVKGIEAMIDQHFASMTAASKETVAAYAKLKAVLNEDQMNKAKELWLQGAG